MYNRYFTIWTTPVKYGHDPGLLLSFYKPDHLPLHAVWEDRPTVMTASFRGWPRAHFGAGCSASSASRAFLDFFALCLGQVVVAVAVIVAAVDGEEQGVNVRFMKKLVSVGSSEGGMCVFVCVVPHPHLCLPPTTCPYICKVLRQTAASTYLQGPLPFYGCQLQRRSRPSSIFRRLWKSTRLPFTTRVSVSIRRRQAL